MVGLKSWWNLVNPCSRPIMYSTMLRWSKSTYQWCLHLVLKVLVSRMGRINFSLGFLQHQRHFIMKTSQASNITWCIYMCYEKCHIHFFLYPFKGELVFNCISKHGVERIKLKNVHWCFKITFLKLSFIAQNAGNITF